MARVKITREIVEKSPGPSKCVSRTQSYVGKGLKRMEIRSVTSESDYENEMYVRYSEDNGGTWTGWVDIYRDAYRVRGGMELLWSRPETGVYNPVHDHYVALNMQRLSWRIIVKATGGFGGRVRRLSPTTLSSGFRRI
ncbi:MAG: hypothetical protein ACP5PQ_03000 [Thermoproteota archaeon]